MKPQLTEIATNFTSVAAIACEKRPSSRGSVGSTAATKIFNLPILLVLYRIVLIL
jgi:hypothetical protein